GIQLASSVGARLPAAVTAVGKSCLAWLPEDEVEQHVDLPLEGDSGRERALSEVRHELEDVREAGYSTDNGGAAAGITCVGAPVFDRSGPRGAVGVSFLRGSDTPWDTIVAEVREAASRATSLLGGRGSK